MENEASLDLGKNLTGALASPSSIETQQGAIDLTKPIPDGDVNRFAENRILYMREADPVGTMPMPTTIKGAISGLQEKMMNGNHVFMDKLGERIAFERTGTRLYEALISKYNGSKDRSGFPDGSILEQFHSEELSHFRLASEVMTEIGGDPTAMTPSADVCGVAALGWVQAMTDPRTDFKQCLEIILQAELVDNACWEVLIELSDQLGLKSVSERFQTALNEEMVHLTTIKQWVRDLNVEGKLQAQLKQ
jgi:ferritin-like protein